MTGVIYIAHIKIPSHRAYSVNAMHLTEALGQVFSNAVLFCERQRGCRDRNAKSIMAEYRVNPKNFDLRFIDNLNVRFIDSLNFMLSVYAKIFFDGKLSKTDHIIFTRDILCALIGCMFGYRVIYEAHMPFSKWYLKLIFRTCLSHRRFHFIAITNALMDEFRSTYRGVESVKRIVLSDGARPCSDSYFRINDRPILSCGYVGNLYPGKGMEVISKLSQLDQSIEYHIFGGTSSDVDYWKQRCSKNVTFYGHLTQRELHQKMDCFQIALAPLGLYISPDGGDSDIAKWTSPLKVFEYMAYRKLIVASNLPALQEVLSDSSNSIIVPTFEPEDWLCALRKILSKPEWAETLANQGYQDLKNNFQWRVRADKIKTWLLNDA